MLKIQWIVMGLQMLGMFFIFYCAYRSWKNIPRITVHRIENDEDGWIPIERFNEYKPTRHEYFLVTDGVRVECCFDLDYNENGKPIISKYFNRSLVTHWRPYPEPPGKK